MHGIAVLVVEEEYLIAADIEQTLLNAGAARVDIFPRIEAIDPVLIDATRPTLAILEARLGAPPVVAFARALRDKGIAVVVTSADRAVSTLFTDTVPLEKPFDSAALLKACELATRSASPCAKPA